MNQSNSDLFEAFLKQIPGVIFQLQVHSNGSNKFIFISENVEDIYELNALDVLEEADLLYSRVHPEDLFLKISSLEHSRKTLQKWELEYRVILPSKGVKWLLGVANPQKLSDGSVMFYGYISDITDKKRGEQKLDSAVKNLTRAESTAHIGSWTLDVFYNLLEWSDEFYNILEIDKQIFSPSYQSYFSVIHPDDRKFVGHVYTTSLQTKEKYQIVYRLQMKDGRIKYVQEHCEHEFDTNAKHLFSFGTLQDVTQEQTNKLILENQKNELQAIFETSKDGIAIMDLESKFLDFNDAYLELTGYTREELMQKSCLEMTDPADKERTLGAMGIVFEKGFISNYEKHCIKKNGSKISVSMSVVLMPDKTRLLITAKDITQNKKFEEQAKLASMGEMIGNIAHQWRQPLSVISTIASGVKLSLEFDTFMKTNAINEMQTIVDQTQYLSKTIDDFRSFIKNSNEGFVLNLDEFLSKTISIVSPRLKNNNINLYLNLNYNALIYGYENELIQAFINIISNARDAILEQNLEDKDKIICIETNKIEQGVQVLIYDSGGGIDAKVIDKIFEPYFTTKHKSIGTGIGLSMARQIIVEHHHASINVQNKTFSINQKEYKGACFEVIFIEENDGNPERI